MHKLVSVNIGKKKVQLRFDDELININPETYIEFKLYPNKEVSDKEYKDILKKDKIQGDYVYALKLISSRMYTVKQIEDKLIKRGTSNKAREEIIKKLTSSNLLNDKDYLETYLTYLNEKLYGELRIKEELKNKGISKEDIAKLSFDEKKEINKASELLNRLNTKYEKYPYLKKKQKVYEALYRYGYPYELIDSVIVKLSQRDKANETKSLKLEYKKAYEKYSKKLEGYELKETVTKYLIRKGYRYNDIKNINE